MELEFYILSIDCRHHLVIMNIYLCTDCQWKLLYINDISFVVVEEFIHGLSLFSMRGGILHKLQCKYLYSNGGLQWSSAPLDLSKEKGQHVENPERQEQCWYEVERGDWGRQSEADAMASASLRYRWQVLRAYVVEWAVDESNQFKLIRCWIGSQWSEFRADVVLVVERVTTRAKECWTRWRWWIRMELT